MNSPEIPDSCRHCDDPLTWHAPAGYCSGWLCRCDLPVIDLRYYVDEVLRGIGNESVAPREVSAVPAIP